MAAHQHDRDLMPTYELCNRHTEEIAAMRAVVEDLKHLIKGNGHDGVIKEHEQAIQYLNKKYDRLVYVGIGIWVAVSFLSGGGAFSLKTLLAFLGHKTP